MTAQTVMSDAHAASFLAARPRLFRIAYRVLGCPAAADDVVQDAWVRWHGTDRSRVRDPAAFLATTTTRLAINVTQSAWARRETSIEHQRVEPVDARADPARGAEQSEALERAARVLLEQLSPAERAVFLLREAFDYSYRQIGEVLDLSEENARQVAARARRRLAGPLRRPVAARTERVLLDAFVAAARTGELAPLEHLLAGGAGGGAIATPAHAPHALAA